MTRRCAGCGEPHEPHREGFAHRFCVQCELAADVAAEYGRDYFADGLRVPYRGQRERMARVRQPRTVPMQQPPGVPMPHERKRP